MIPKIAVVAFPGNNCETESLRAAKGNGFAGEIVRWNEPEKIGQFDAYFLPGGFSFEDRGRSGAISAREKIFDALRAEAEKGKVILGVCNGAQMIVESGMIPIGENPVPFALAENVRRNAEGHVIGTGFYNAWKIIKPERTDTAFTNSVSGLIRIPMAHGEGRFTSVDDKALETLKSGKNVAFRYCDEDGKVDANFPTTPNGAKFAVAMLVNDEGTIGAIMPHPERFYDACDGDQVFQSMRKWIEEKKSPKKVRIGDFSKSQTPKIQPFCRDAAMLRLYLEKKLIITDNEAFTLSQAASNIAGENIKLERSVFYEISPCHSESATADEESLGKIIDSGLILNPNKEVLLPTPCHAEPTTAGRLVSGSQASNHAREMLNQVRDDKTGIKFAVLPFEDDQATALAEKLSKLLGKSVDVKIYKCWNFGNASKSAIKKVLQNRLLANPNSAEIFISTK
ncbi:phosphoribosylformylglycinamidine synthase I [Candidatus Gracilibacteria bacterium]|nr:phosphoribosylformylglycinamidine synthase I [Candidatus Gracilibacteria bacterium]